MRHSIGNEVIMISKIILSEKSKAQFYVNGMLFV